MRQEIAADLILAYGRRNVDSTGNKAVRVDGLAGSRSEVDVVPAFTLHLIRPGSLLGGPSTVEGVAILSRDGHWTFNYPDQHEANGRLKHLLTGRRFKKVVRTIKRIRSEMLKQGVLKEKVPSFLIECLVYLVEDAYFTVLDDDRYDRVRRVLARIKAILAHPTAPYLSEINGIKQLFAPGQAWTLETARSFVDRALIHLGDA
ncbi:MAG: hypothetical protein AAAC47_10805 [Pararhizobium sp.]